jgi:hypothetical protein
MLPVGDRGNCGEGLLKLSIFPYLVDVVLSSFFSEFYINDSFLRNRLLVFYFIGEYLSFLLPLLLLCIDSWVIYSKL